MRARYYNPDIKRFINQDIKVGDIGSSQSLDRYAYCEGNPVRLVDPFGLSPESTQDQGETSKYEKLHNLLGTIGIFFDGADLINGFVYLAEKDYVNAAISFACGIPAVGTVVTAVAKTAKLVKYATKAAKIAKTCRDIGRIGNAAAGMKALYDTYQTAERECETTGEKIAYIAGTVITGYPVGKAANKGAEALKKFASKAIPKLKTALRENARKLAIDEFSNPKIGPRDSAVSGYIKEINTTGKLSTPIEVQKLSTGGYEIVNEHHRWLAAQKAGMKNVPIRIKNYNN